MMTRFLSAALVMLAIAAPARAAGDNFQLFRDVQKQVLQYPHFTIFDSVQAQFDEEGVVTLTGKVTMPYKRNDLEKRVARLDGVTEVQNQIEVLPVSQFDDDLRLRIARAIYGNSNFWRYASMVNPPIHIIVECSSAVGCSYVGSSCFDNRTSSTTAIPANPRAWLPGAIGATPLMR
jgi:hyperosmotically inducible protein